MSFAELCYSSNYNIFYFPSIFEPIDVDERQIVGRGKCDIRIGRSDRVSEHYLSVGYVKSTTSRESYLRCLQVYIEGIAKTASLLSCFVVRQISDEHRAPVSSEDCRSG